LVDMFLRYTKLCTDHQSVQLGAGKVSHDQTAL